MSPYLLRLRTMAVLFLLFTFYLRAEPFQDRRDSRDNPDTLAAQWLKDCFNLREKGQYSLALDTGLKALKIFQQSGNTSLAAQIEVQIAQVFMYLGE
ncbi:MAG TPA: hypothetical protein VHC48_21170, partial [Puia sp.]|nr:hypothetical protein [Puia sp.]